jgi:hypothetical protein
MLGRELTWGLREAALERAVRRMAGRCSGCGEARRLRETWHGWVLRCDDVRHPAVALSAEALRGVAEELTCPECKRSGLVVGEAPDLAIGCACGGRMPTLEELFGSPLDWPASSPTT